MSNRKIAVIAVAILLLIIGIRRLTIGPAQPQSFSGSNVIDYYQAQRANTTWFSPGVLKQAHNVQVGLPNNVDYNLDDVALYLHDYALIRQYLIEQGVPALDLVPGKNVEHTTLLYVYDENPPEFLEEGEVTIADTSSAQAQVFSIINLKNSELHDGLLTSDPTLGLARHLRLTQLHAQAACLSVFTEVSQDSLNKDFKCNFVSRNLAQILVGRPTDVVQANLMDVELYGEVRETPFLLLTVETFVTWMNARP